MAGFRQTGAQALAAADAKAKVAKAAYVRAANLLYGESSEQAAAANVLRDKAAEADARAIVARASGDEAADVALALSGILAD